MFVKLYRPGLSTQIVVALSIKSNKHFDSIYMLFPPHFVQAVSKQIRNPPQRWEFLRTRDTPETRFPTFFNPPINGLHFNPFNYGFLLQLPQIELQHKPQKNTLRKSRE